MGRKRLIDNRFELPADERAAPARDLIQRPTNGHAGAESVWLETAERRAAEIDENPSLLIDGALADMQAHVRLR